MRCSSARSRCSCRCSCSRRPRSPRPGAAASRSTISRCGNFHYILFEQTQAQNAIINTFVYSGITAFAAHRAGARHRLYRDAQAGAVRRRAGVPLHGAVRGARHRAGDRLLCRLCAAAARALRHRGDPDPRLHHALPADRLYANARPAMRGINPEMEEAVRILGGGRLLAIRKVLAPLLKRSRCSARWLLVFIPATRELSTAIFLSGPNTRVMSVLLFDLTEEGNFEVLSALGMILLVTTLIIAAIGFKADRPRLHAARPDEQAASCAASRSATATSRRSPASTSTLQRRRVRLAARTLRLRQDHDVAHDRRLHRADRRHDRDGRPDAVLAVRRAAAGEAAACR